MNTGTDASRAVTPDTFEDSARIQNSINHIANTGNPHATDIGNLGSGTLAELNTAVTDATLDDSSSSRTPSGSAGGDLTGTYPNPTVVSSSETVSGKIEIATQSETDTGTDDVRAVTPLKLHTKPLGGDVTGTISSTTVISASDTVAGKVELATTAETDTGTDTTRAVTPLGLANTTQVVHQSGNETITGVKDFTGQISMTSTTDGFILPRMTTVERDLVSAVAGEMIYNTTTNKLNFYNGSAWEAVTSA